MRNPFSSFRLLSLLALALSLGAVSPAAAQAPVATSAQPTAARSCWKISADCELVGPPVRMSNESGFESL